MNSKMMNELILLKENANKAFNKGLDTPSDSKKFFIDACFRYGNCLEKIMEIESSFSTIPIDLVCIKPNVLLNLGMANFHLKDFDACIQCCNAAITFCNDPELLLGQMKSLNELRDRILPSEPVVKKYRSTY